MFLRRSCLLNVFLTLLLFSMSHSRPPNFFWFYTTKHTQVQGCTHIYYGHEAWHFHLHRSWFSFIGVSLKVNICQTKWSFVAATSPSSTRSSSSSPLEHATKHIPRIYLPCFTKLRERETDVTWIGLRCHTSQNIRGEIVSVCFSSTDRQTWE